MNKIIGIYKITNTVTGDFYIGSSKDIKRRLASHKCQSTWNEQPNNPMYLDMRKYGLDKFSFQILEIVEEGQLKEIEQQFIETLKPTYNQVNAKGWDIERKKKAQKEYQKTDKYKQYHKEYDKEYKKSDKYKEYMKEYQKSDKCKQYHKEYKKEYNNQLCCYNGEVLTLCALSKRFCRAGIPHPVLEGKKYLLKQ